MARPDAEISVVFCDDPFIQQLNAEWMNRDRPTDVLSFPLFDDASVAPPEAPLGDVVINLDYAERLVAEATHHARVADELGVPPSELAWDLFAEVEFLFIHGLLHLVGHDHATADEEARMKAEERRLWLAAAPARA